MKEIKEYKNLTNLLLDLIRTRPGMYLGEPKISNLVTFIIGYQMANDMNSNSIDEFYGENGFNKWFMNLKGIERLNSIATPFLEEADNNEKRALDIYFEYLSKYRAEKNVP